jgi:type IV secretory pathway VirB10-like protein
VPAGAVAARHAGVLIAPGRGVAGLSMQTRNASNASPRPIRRKVAPKKATPMAAAVKRRQPKKACTVKPALPPPLFLDPGQVEMPYEEGPEETEVYPKIGEMIQVRLLHHPTCPPTLCITSSTGGAGSD